MSRTFDPVQVEELIKQSFRLAPENYFKDNDWLPTDIESAIAFVSRAANLCKKIKNDRYIYHYSCKNFEGDVFTGVAQLPFRIVGHDDLEKVKKFLQDKWGHRIYVVVSLSYLGREHD